MLNIEATEGRNVLGALVGEVGCGDGTWDGTLEGRIVG